MTLEYITYILKCFEDWTEAYASFSMIVYFNWTSLIFLLTKAIGYSMLLLFFCNNIPAIVSLEVKENIKKYFEKSELTRNGVDMMASLIVLNYCLVSSSLPNSQSFFNNFHIGLTIFTKFGINLLMKFIFLKNNFTTFLHLSLHETSFEG